MFLFKSRAKLFAALEHSGKVFGANWKKSADRIKTCILSAGCRTCAIAIKSDVRNVIFLSSGGTIYISSDVCGDQAEDKAISAHSLNFWVMSSKAWLGKGTGVGGIWLGKSWTSAVRFPSEEFVSTDMAWRERIRLESRLGPHHFSVFQPVTPVAFVPSRDPSDSPANSPRYAV